MTNSHLLILLEESGLSPEALGARIGISGMSIRRWLKEPKATIIPDPYSSAFQYTIQKMMIEGGLDSASRSVSWAFQEIGSLPQRAALSALGLDLDLHEAMGPAGGGDEDRILGVLNQLGQSALVEKKVEEQANEIASHCGRDREWSSRLSVLSKVMKSKKISRFEKSVAVGALFYLIFAFDLIPDSLPIFGLIDDFTIVGFAATYYKQRNQKDL